MLVVPVTISLSIKSFPERSEILIISGDKTADGVLEYVNRTFTVLWTRLGEMVIVIVTGTVSLDGLIKLLIVDWAVILAATPPVEACSVLVDGFV